ncbi:hypothetical protein WJX79_008485 [Trebouxia sp. C0005]
MTVELPINSMTGGRAGEGAGDDVRGDGDDGGSAGLVPGEYSPVVGSNAGAVPSTVGQDTVDTTGADTGEITGDGLSGNGVSAGLVGLRMGDSNSATGPLPWVVGEDPGDCEGEVAGEVVGVAPGEAARKGDEGDAPGEGDDEAGDVDPGEAAGEADEGDVVVTAWETGDVTGASTCVTGEVTGASTWVTGEVTLVTTGVTTAVTGEGL